MRRFRFPRPPFVAAACVLLAAAAHAAVIDQEADISGRYMQLLMAPGDGGVIHQMRLLTGAQNLVGPAGILLEGFGVASPYVPNRRLNETLEALEEFGERPVLRFSYDCQGPNIDGLHVTRLMEPLPDEAALRVTWTVENRGTESQWVAPWIGNDVLPGGGISADDRLDLPSDAGVVRATRTAWHVASRNWLAVTAPAAQESLYWVFNSDQIHSYLTLWGESSVGRGVQAAFVPVLLKPGASWKTVYRLGVTRGLRRVDFATDELAVQLEYTPGALLAYIATVKPMTGVRIDASVVAENGRVWKLQGKQFDTEPGKVIRCTYAWEAPADGHYDFMAQLKQGGLTLPLGVETGSPHGGIDTRFAVGAPKPRRMEPWTDAPHALDRGARTLERAPAFAGEPLLWVESALEKVFREDRVKAKGAPSPVARVSLARGEREAFQVCMRPETAPLLGVSFTPGDLVSETGDARIPAADITVADVGWVPVRIPSHFEGPTGSWPDPLTPHKPFVADRGTTSAVWVTIFARPGLPAGVYRGPLRLATVDGPQREFTIEARVLHFDLPATPGLKTDFGYWEETAVAGAKARGGSGNPDALLAAYMKNALEHRVTLREAAALPAPGPGDYAATLQKHLPDLRAALAGGATTLAAPPALLDAPEKLAALEAFVKREKLEGRVFVPLSHEPAEPAWPRLMESLAKWRAGAPSVPAAVGTLGLRPFLPDDVGLWCVHAQVMDTPAGIELLKRISGGREVWWYFSHQPPRPYGNLFLDFTAVEHRILFWQTWALGMRGVQYWCVNYAPEGQDPFTDPLDTTPVNGDGCLVYPGKDGPVNSVRWETVRDGIEDYDYLALFTERRAALAGRAAPEALTARVKAAGDLSALLPSLVTFARDTAELLKKRGEIGETIVEMGRALKAAPAAKAPMAPPAPPAPKPASPALKPAPPAPGVAPGLPGSPAPLPAPAPGPTRNFGAKP